MTAQVAGEKAATKVATMLLSRGSDSFTSAGGEIPLYEGDVSGYRTIRLAVTAFVPDGGLMIKVYDVEDPALPIVLQESVAETGYQELRTTLDVPGRRLAVRIWVDDHPGQQIQVTWGIWGRPD